MENFLRACSFIIAIAAIYKFLDERETNKSHWKATETELNEVWYHINQLEGTVITFED